MATLTYLQAISSRAARRAARRRARAADGRGHRRVRRRLQGDRRLHRRVRARPRDGHAAGRVGDHRLRGRRRRRRHAARCARCSSPTSSRAASTSSSTSPARCTTARGWRCRSPCGCRRGGGFSGGPFHSQNPEAWFMHAPGIKVRRAVDRRGREGAAARGDPRPQPGLLHGAQAPLPAHQGRGARGRLRDADDRARGARRAPTWS